MKPRIVRNQWDKKPCLELPWPTECPWGPEAVMAACERAGWTLRGVPEITEIGWQAPVWELSRFQLLTPEFMAEKCEHKPFHQWNPMCNDAFTRCLKCGAILSDRRHGERRKGERRRMDKNLGDDRRGHIKTWYRPERPDRRTGKDRRKEEPHD